MLSEMPNIGPKALEWLSAAGITTSEQLIKQGSEAAFIKISLARNYVCINTLYALEGAIQGIKSSELSANDKARLKLLASTIKARLR